MKHKGVSEPRPYSSRTSRAKWIVYYFDAEKRRRWSKYFHTKDEADNFYQETRVLENRLGVEANRISFDDKRELIEAKRLLEPYKISVLELAHEYIRLSKELAEYNVSIQKAVEEFKKVNKAKERSTSLQKAIEKYYDWLYTKELDEGYRQKVYANLKRFMKSLGNGKIVSLITSKEIEKWILSLTKFKLTDSPDISTNGRPLRVFAPSDEPVSIRTRNEYRITLFTFFKYCKMQDWLDFNPVERIASWRERPKTPQIFTPEETQKILDSTAPQSDIRAYAAIAAFAGIRQAELQRLRWDKIKLDDREIILDGEITKTASRRVVKITENLAKWLTPYADKLHRKEFIVAGCLQEKLKKLHMSLGKDNWVANGFRHSAATYYLALTKNSYLTAEQMGHAVDVLKQHYNGLAREKDAIRYFEIIPND